MRTLFISTSNRNSLVSRVGGRLDNLIVLPRQFFQRFAVGFRDQKRKYYSEEIDHTEKDERVPVASVGLFRVCALRSVEKPIGANDGASFSGGCRDTVASGPEPCWEDFNWDHKSGRVRAKVGEEERQGVHDDEADAVLITAKRYKRLSFRHPVNLTDSTHCGTRRDPPYAT
ncbi:hypothetical protein L1987_56536 [Smallanthus sonchifolius]|uniref:Uncharacterized protein n=1 Tax=Smallanthus sonchifolius TaxID=185202 RepID=A0ACB9ECM2_9ASTR|nr:hypothetical protein L1987_56536 [Smallanthus sonchifolius]